MKVLYFIDGLAAGGKERRLVELMKGIRSDGNFEFELVVMNSEVHYREVFDLGIKIHYLIRKTRKDLSGFYKVYKICKNFRPDIIHCWDSMTAVYSIPTCIRLRIKLVNGMIADAPDGFNFFNKSWFRTQLTFLFLKIPIFRPQRAARMVSHLRSAKRFYWPAPQNLCQLLRKSLDCPTSSGKEGDLR